MTDEHVIRWTDAAGRPRRLRFCERSLGGVDRIEEEWADDRGRVTLGADLAGKTVTVAVLEVDDDESDTG